MATTLVGSTYRLPDLPWRHCFTGLCGVIEHTWITGRNGDLGVAAGRIEVPGTSYDSRLAAEVMTLPIKERVFLATAAILAHAQANPPPGC
jgi:hypothetical protein